MSKPETSGRPIVAMLLLSLVAAGCAHKATASQQIHDGFVPFSTTRNQAVSLVAYSKRTLGAADINTLAVSYTALQEKANAYADFMVESVTTSSFDPNRNARYAADFAKAIAAFDKAYAALVVTRRAMLADTWVPTFAQSLQDRWDRYNGLLAQMTPQTKLDLIADIKRETVWPNFENIATEPVASSR
jgi:hypothetical protein